MPEWIAATWPYVSTGVGVVLSVVATVHAVLHKREVRAAIGWVGVIWLVPLLGVLLYWLLGINRVHRKARELRAVRLTERPSSVASAVSPESLGRDGLADLALLVERVTTRPLLAGNEVTPLVDGDRAYPAMLAAIESARRTIALGTYIFDDDRVGRRFVDALVAARERGVEVRVLIDALGLRYSFPPITRRLRRGRIRHARFMPIRHATALNLRNHRKILVVDGAVGFTGGINIREHCVLADRPPVPTRDLHCRVEGPIVSQILSVFAEDWEYTTRESLGGDEWFPSVKDVGPVLARTIVDGPDDDIDKIPWTLAGAIGCARESIRIMTPYFLPDLSLAGALNVAALRGVTVDIVLPEHGNLPLVQWAMWAQLFMVLGRGCRVFMTPRPFDHSKAMVVDRRWSFVGSSNWDPRSLRLNFELGLECYDPGLASQLAALIDERIADARPITQKEVDGRSLPRKIRDGLARLVSPYL